MRGSALVEVVAPAANMRLAICVLITNPGRFAIMR